MSWRDGLLTQAEPLEEFEIRELEDWLLVMQQDCEDFGPTPDDIARMGAIEARIFAERERA